MGKTAILGTIMTSLAVATMIGAMLLQGCKEKPATEPQPQHPTESAPHGNVADPESIPDLVITDVYPKTLNGQKVIEVVVKNTGQTTSSGVTGACSYSCQSQSVSVSNQSFLQSGFIAPGRSVTGTLAVTPCPDTNIPVDCTVDESKSIQESNEKNNNWSGQVKIN